MALYLSYNFFLFRIVKHFTRCGKYSDKDKMWFDKESIDAKKDTVKQLEILTYTLISSNCVNKNE